MADPRDFTCSETLRNGLAVTIRHLRADDRERIANAVRQLDRESIYTRLFSYRNELTEAGLDRIMRVVPGQEVALVVTAGAGDDEIVIGSGRYIVTNPDARRAHRGGGVRRRGGLPGPRHRQPAAAAFRANSARAGIVAFEADVLAENKSMIKVFARAGLPAQAKRRGHRARHALAARRSGVDPRCACTAS